MENLPKLTAAIAEFFDLEIVKIAFLISSLWVLWLAADKFSPKEKDAKKHDRFFTILFLLFIFVFFALDDLMQLFPSLVLHKKNTSEAWLILAFFLLWLNFKKNLFGVSGFFLFYSVFSFQIVRECLRDTFYDASFFATGHNGILFILLSFACINIAYSLFYLYSIYLLINIKNNALMYLQISLATYPVFTSLIPFLINVLLNFNAHTMFENGVEQYSMREFFSALFVLWNIPWFLYFTFSQTMRAIWAALESDAHESGNKTPPAIS